MLGLGTALALLASVLPYSLELAALRRLPTATFAVMMSLGPAIAAVAGWLVLGQALHPVEVLAIVLVVAASAGAVRAAASPTGPAPSAAPPAVPVPPDAAGRPRRGPAGQRSSRSAAGAAVTVTGRSRERSPSAYVVMPSVASSTVRAR